MGFKGVISSLVFAVSLFVGSTFGNEVKDVENGAGAVLECRFNPVLLSRDTAFYWIRTNKRDKDNVAIGERPLEDGYDVDFRPSEGRYDLYIKGATYGRDNGEFECKLKEVGTGDELHTKRFQLTVLLPPGVPKVSPTAPVAVEGRTIDLECSSSGGSPDPQIKWYREGSDEPLESVLIPGGGKDQETRGILRVVPKKEDDGGKFTCIVWNRALPQGHTLSSSLKLTVNYFPRVTVGPENPVLVEEGGRALFSCSVDARPPPNSVTWTRHGKFLATGYTFTLDRVSLPDSGAYVCQADNGLGQLGQASIDLELLHGPMVSTEGRREAGEGEDVQLTCQVQSNPPPSRVDWIKVGDSGFRRSGHRLTLPQVTAQDAGVYVCKAVVEMEISGLREPKRREGNGTVELVIRHAPGSSEVKVAGAAVVGEPLTLECGSDPPGWPIPVYRWWKGEDYDRALPSASSRFVVPSIDMNAQGLYHCQAENALGLGSPGSMMVEVNQRPRVIKSPPPSTVRKVGDPEFSVSCTAQGKPKPAVEWLKDGDQVGLEFEVRNEEEEIEGGRGIYRVKSTLSLHRALGPEDRGRYTCRFTSPIGEDESSLLLRIQHLPIAVESRRDLKAAADLGSDAVLTCKVRAFPRPTFSWRSGTTLNPSPGGKYETNSSTIQGDLHIGVLQIKGVTNNDYGVYTCEARNELGSTESVVSLGARGPPESPEELEAQAIGPNWVLLGWMEGFDGGFPDTLYHVSASKRTRGEKDRPLMFDCIDNNPCNITGLEEQSTYEFQVKAINRKGESGLSSTAVLSTALHASGIPQPEQVFYGEEAKIIRFSVISASLQLLGIAELEDLGGNWIPISASPFIIDSNIVEVPVGAEEAGILRTVRVKTCLRQHPDICSDGVQATRVRSLSGPLVAPWSFPLEYLVTVVVCSVGFFVALALLAYCCCRKNSKENDKGFEANASLVRPSLVTGQPPPPYYANGEPGYGTANGIYGSAPRYGVADGGGTNGGGSVNSQESLWKPPSSSVEESSSSAKGFYPYATQCHNPVPHLSAPTTTTDYSYYHKEDASFYSRGEDPYGMGVPDYFIQSPNSRVFNESVDSTSVGRTKRVIHEVIV